MDPLDRVGSMRSAVVDIPTTRLFSVCANGDTIAAGADTAVYVSTNAGANWVRSTKPISGVTSIQALWIRECITTLFIHPMGPSRDGLRY